MHATRLKRKKIKKNFKKQEKNNQKKFKGGVIMSKITIDLPKKTHETLKEFAKKDERSLTNYITVILNNVAGTTDVPIKVPNPNIFGSTQAPNDDRSAITGQQKSSKTTVDFNGDDNIRWLD